MANKYRAKGRYIKGQYYGSKLEVDFYNLQQLRVKAGEIVACERLREPVQFASGIKWKVDFLVMTNNGEGYFVETKGVKTEAYRLKLKLYKHEIIDPLFVIGRKNKHWYIIDEHNTAGVMPPI